MKRLKKLIVIMGFLLMVAFCFRSGVASAAVSTDGLYTYEVDETTRIAVLTSYMGQETEVVVPETVDGHSVGYLDGTFRDKNTITQISLSGNIVGIKETAFVGCKALQSFSVTVDNPNYCSTEDGLLMSKDQTVLVRYPVGKHQTSGTYTIPETVSTLSGYSFEGYNTANIVIPSTVITIGDYAFANTGNFNEITSWAEGTQQIGVHAFSGCVNLKATLPASVTKIGAYGFAYCTNIQIDISKCGLTEIAEYLFYECDNLHQLTLPVGVTTIGAYAFYKCDNLNQVTLPDSVHTIQEGAFSSCTNLHSITIPEGVTAIENNTFDGCQNLNTVVLPSTLSTIGDNAFSGCQNIHSINIPANVSYISNTSFEGLNINKIGLTCKVPGTKLKSVKKSGKKKVKLVWKKTKGVTGYVVYRSNKKGKGYRAIKKITGSKKNTYQDSKVKKGKKYYYKIRTFKSIQKTSYYSKYSNMKSKKIK